VAALSDWQVGALPPDGQAGLGDLAMPLSGSAMSTQAACEMRPIAAVTSAMWRTEMGQRGWWRRQAARTVADQKPESARSVAGPVAPAGGSGRWSG